MGKRRRAREAAIQCLYQWDVTGADPDSILAGYWETHPDAEPELSEFMEELFHGTITHISMIDAMISEQMRHWRMDRLGRVEKGILRLGCYELLHEADTPAAVVIDEAVELSKRFSGDEAGSFINGVLDGMRLKLRGDPAAVPPEEPVSADGAEEPSEPRTETR